MLDSRSWDGWKRLSASVANQVAQDDPAALRQYVDQLAHMQAQLPVLVRLLHETGGYSWGEIAAELGITRQAAHKRFGQGVSSP